jgi:AcrR family transcriptional regulator
MAAAAPPPDAPHSRRERILDAAFALLLERGYAHTSTLDIASRARVSKRELYTLVGDKQTIVSACVARRAEQLRLPLRMAPPHDQATLAATLVRFGASVLRQLSDPPVVALYRLATIEAADSPEIARVLDTTGRTATRTALLEVLHDAQASGLLGPGEPAAMASAFFGLLWGDLHVRLLLGVAERPTSHAMQRRARAATEALLRLYPVSAGADRP